MKKKISKLERTAYHEAGHTVVAHILEHRTKRVSIIPDESGNSLGHHAGHKTTIKPDIYMTSRHKSWLEEEAIICFAGGIAEKLFSGRYNHVGAAEDRQSAVNYASYISVETEELEALLKWLWIKTENILKYKRNWGAVEALANELLKRQKLNGREAKDIIFKALYPDIPGAEGLIKSLRKIEEKDKKKTKSHDPR